jgi:hypothetical protein
LAANRLCIFAENLLCTLAANMVCIIGHKVTILEEAGLGRELLLGQEFCQHCSGLSRGFAVREEAEQTHRGPAHLDA